MKQLLFIGLGGFIGSIARYGVSRLNITWQFFNIPMGTLTVNIVGSFLIGLISGLFISSMATSENLRLFLITGICGGFTTFSAFTFENYQLLQSGHYASAATYMGVSILLGILAVLGGLWLSKLLV